jgi:ABC-type branched-subunit amino acid transport system ATPase component
MLVIAQLRRETGMSVMLVEQPAELAWSFADTAPRGSVPCSGEKLPDELAYFWTGNIGIRL